MKFNIVIFSLFCGTLFFGQNNQDTVVWTLPEMVDYAAINNLNIQRLYINQSLLDNDIIQTQRQKLPDLNANFGNSIILGVEGIPITNSNQEFIGTTNGYQLYQNSINVNSSIVLYNHGLFDLNEDRARLRLAEQKERIKASVNDISLNIINLYLNILLNREILLVAEQQLDFSQQQLNRVQILYDAGSVPLSNVYEAKAQVASDKAAIENSKIDLERSKFNLAQILQLPNYEIFDVERIEPKGNLEPNLYDLETILQTSYATQPAILATEIATAAAEKDIEIAKTGYWPRLVANYGLGTSFRQYLNGSFDTDNLPSQWWDNHTHNFSLNLNIPIFDRYQNDMNVENAEIRLDLASNSIALEKQSIKEDIQEAYFLLNSTYQQYLANLELLKSTQLSYEFAEKSFKAGRLSIYDFNQARNQLFRAKSQLLQSKYNYVFREKLLDFYSGKPLTIN